MRALATPATPNASINMNPTTMRSEKRWNPAFHATTLSAESEVTPSSSRARVIAAFIAARSAESEAMSPGITKPDASSNRSGMSVTSRVVSCWSAVARPLGPVFILCSASRSVLPFEASAETTRMSGGRTIGSFVVVFM